YEAEDRPALFDAPRQYGLGQTHKHLPEMATVCGLDYAPVFSPVVAPYYAGMEVTLPLFASDFVLPVTVREVEACYRSYYTSGVVRVRGNADENGFLSAGALTGRDDMEIAVFGNDERIVLTARFDNLGKGASGAAIQNMNLLLDVNETEGLIL
ncbi:MAG: N-acetyl-gamma-glutamyl-phosphate reductase, partial [Clostridia bacterium]|nr:N-acetyl-gamma-glutamyl-phosphate reductase [Clostridia bacterium]